VQRCHQCPIEEAIKIETLFKDRTFRTHQKRCCIPQASWSESETSETQFRKRFSPGKCALGEKNSHNWRKAREILFVENL